MIGKMRQRLTIESVSLASDSQGGSTETWSTHATVWGEVVPLSDSQRFFSDQLQHRVTHRVTIRYLSTLESNMRFKEGTRYYYIKSFQNQGERDRFHVCNCEEGVGVAS